MNYNKVSTLTNFLIISYVYPSLSIFENIEIKQVGYLVLAELLSYFVMTNLDLKVFPRLFPEYKDFFPFIKEDKLKEKLDFGNFESISSFPFKRSIYLFFISLVKVSFSGYVFVYYCEHGLKPSLAWILFWVVEIGVSIFYSSSSFIELHMMLSEYLKKVNHSFENAGNLFNSKKKYFHLNEYLTQSSLGIILLSQIVLFSLNLELNSIESKIKFCWFAFSGFFMLFWIYHLYRRYFTDAIFETYNRIGENLSDLSKVSEVSFIKVHSLRIIAGFEFTFNQLLKNIKNRDRELMQWVLNESESSRFRTIGEISGLVAHDIRGPLQAINFCVEELKNICESKKQTEYLGQIEKSFTRIEELVNNLLVTIREPDLKGNSSFIECHRQAISVLKLEIPLIEKIHFDLASSGDYVPVKMLQKDLVHILYNLYKNSSLNLINNNVEDPRISVVLFFDKLNDNLTLTIEDNGTGLESEVFEKLTKLNVEDEDDFKDSFSRGLGLRLVRILLSKHEGEIKVQNLTKFNKSGSQFIIKIPISLSNFSSEESNIRQLDEIFHVPFQNESAGQNKASQSLS